MIPTDEDILSTFKSLDIIWKGINDIRSDYQISNLGNIRRLLWSSQYTFLSGRLTHNGYLRVRLRDAKGNPCDRFIHRLVLDAFIGPRPDGYQANHKNGIKNDNRSINLEWVSPTENMKHAVNMGLLTSRKGEKHPMTSIHDKDVLEMRKRYIGGEKPISIARAYNLPYNVIWQIVKRVTWRHI